MITGGKSNRYDITVSEHGDSFIDRGLLFGPTIGDYTRTLCRLNQVSHSDRSVRRRRYRVEQEFFQRRKRENQDVPSGKRSADKNYVIKRTDIFLEDIKLKEIGQSKSAVDGFAGRDAQNAAFIGNRPATGRRIGMAFVKGSQEHSFTLRRIVHEDSEDIEFENFLKRGTF